MSSCRDARVYHVSAASPTDTRSKHTTTEQTSTPWYGRCMYVGDVIEFFTMVKRDAAMFG